MGYSQSGRIDGVQADRWSIRKGWLRSSELRCISLWLASVAIASAVAAATLELPADWPLGVDSQLVFELDNADLHLTSRAEGLPVFRARVATEGEGASLETVSSGGRLTVRRAAGQGAPPVPRLRLDVELGPGRTVRIAGTDLVVRVTDALLPESGRSAFRLALESSTADLAGARVSEIEAVASSLELTGTEGSLTLRLTGGSTQVQGHQGRLELEATDAGVAVTGHQGQLVSHLEGGSLEIAGGEGTFEGTAAEAQLTFDGWRGPVVVRGADSAIDALGAEHQDRWQIEGRELQVVLERVWGEIVATLEGGSLRGSDLSASVEAAASESARLDLVEVAGGAVVELSDGAEAWITGVTGGCEAALTDSRLEVERIDRLTLSGARAQVTARGIAHLAPVEMTASELDLDLREARQGATLDLRGAGWARVRLEAPCVVQLTGAGDAFDSPVEVTGCDLRAAGQEVSRRQERGMYGGSIPIRLTLTAGSDTVVAVEGEPGI